MENWVPVALPICRPNAVSTTTVFGLASSTRAAASAPRVRWSTPSTSASGRPAAAPLAGSARVRYPIASPARAASVAAIAAEAPHPPAGRRSLSPYLREPPGL